MRKCQFTTIECSLAGEAGLLSSCHLKQPARALQNRDLLTSYRPLLMEHPLRAMCVASGGLGTENLCIQLASAEPLSDGRACARRGGRGIRQGPQCLACLGIAVRLLLDGREEACALRLQRVKCLCLRTCLYGGHVSNCLKVSPFRTNWQQLELREKEFLATPEAVSFRETLSVGLNPSSTHF